MRVHLAPEHGKLRSGEFFIEACGLGIEPCESVRSTALSALLSQRGALAMKRVEAAQGLWNGIRELKKRNGIAMRLEILNLDEVVKELDNPKMQQTLRAIAPPSVTSDDYLANINQYETHRPFISPTAWALYAAYTSIIVFSVSNMEMLQIGYYFRRFLKVRHWTALLGATLPRDEVSILDETDKLTASAAGALTKAQQGDEK